MSPSLIPAWFWASICSPRPPRCCGIASTTASRMSASAFVSAVSSNAYARPETVAKRTVSTPPTSSRNSCMAPNAASGAVSRPSSTAWTHTRIPSWLKVAAIFAACAVYPSMPDDVRQHSKWQSPPTLVRSRTKDWNSGCCDRPPCARNTPSSTDEGATGVSPRATASSALARLACVSGGVRVVAAARWASLLKAGVRVLNTGRRGSCASVPQP